MHAKSDSDVTSLPESSPPQSPPRAPRHSHGIPRRPPPPAYYVQSPSRDSHDGADSKVSFQSTPLLSAVPSPLHPLLTASQELSSPSLPPDASARKHHHRNSRNHRILPQPRSSSPSSDTASSHNSLIFNHGYHKKRMPTTIYENDDEYGIGASKSSSTASRIYTFLCVLLSSVAFLFFFILVFWLICRPSRPVLSIKNIVFHNLYMSQGMDASMVPTMLLSVNSTVQIDYENRSRYFKAHLNPLSVNLLYSKLTVASTEMDGYVQDKSTRKVISIGLKATTVPLYGAAAISSTTTQSISVSTSISMCSQYYVVGHMVKSRFCSSIVCNLAVSSSSMALLTSIKKACTYDPPIIQ